MVSESEAQPARILDDVPTALIAGTPPLESNPKLGSYRSEDLLPIMYHELRSLARARLRNGPGGAAGHTLQPTALVHEAYLRLAGSDGASDVVEWKGPAHFFGAAAEAMRQVLVDHARAKGALKRGGDRRRLDLHEEAVQTGRSEFEGLLVVNDAVEQLEKEDPLLGTILKLRYFAGLGNDEAAAAVDLPLRTFERRWRYIVARIQEMNSAS